MLVLLCKDFYCYLLEISLSQPHYPSMDKLLGFGETSPISHIKDFPFGASTCKQKKHTTNKLNCKFQYLLRNSTPVHSQRLSGTPLLAGEVYARTLSVKILIIFTTAVLFVAVFPSALKGPE